MSLVGAELLLFVRDSRWLALFAALGFLSSCGTDADSTSLTRPSEPKAAPVASISESLSSEADGDRVEMDLLHALPTTISVAPTYSCDDPSSIVDASSGTIFRGALALAASVNGEIAVEIPADAEVTDIEIQLGASRAGQRVDEIDVLRNGVRVAGRTLDTSASSATRLGISGGGGRWSFRLASRAGRLSVAEVRVFGLVPAEQQGARSPTIEWHTPLVPANANQARALVAAARRELREHNRHAERQSGEESRAALTPSETWDRTFLRARLDTARGDLALVACATGQQRDRFDTDAESYRILRPQVRDRLSIAHFDVTAVDEFFTWMAGVESSIDRILGDRPCARLPALQGAD